MSRKAGLAKKIAHTLMAMSIVYSSGINIVVNEVYAAEKILLENEEIKHGGEFTKSGTPGNDFSASGGITDGEDLSYTGVIKTSDLSGQLISIKATGGKGGEDNADDPTVKQGAKGGDAIAKVTIDGTLSSVTTGDIAVSAYAGANGSAYQGTSGVSGAAAAYGLELKHDLTITAADITVKAGMTYHTPGIGGRTDIAGDKHSEAMAVGLKVDSGTVDFTAGKIKVIADSEVYNLNVDVIATERTKLSDGGDAAAYGIQVNGGEVSAKLTGDIVFDKVLGADGSGTRTEVNTGKGVDGGNGGNAYAYGVDVNGGIAHLDLQNITIDNVTYSGNYINGGVGGIGAGTGNSAAAAGKTGNTGKITAFGVNAEGGQTDGNIKTIKIELTNKNGNDSSDVVNRISANGGTGGAGGGVDKSDGSSYVAAGTGGDGGDGGSANAYGVFGSGSSRTVIVADKISAEAVAGAGGAGATSSNDGYDSGVATSGSDGASTPDNNVLTSLNNATLGFSGTSADRKVTGGTLQLSGSNEFRVTTDLANNKSDRFNFAKLASGSSMEEQYITVGYDKAFDGSSADSISGSNVVVLSVADLNGQTLGNFVGKESIMDDPLSRFSATPTVVVDDTEVRISKIDLNKDIGPSDTMIISNDASLALRNVWRIEGNNVMKRMGELRSGTEAGKGGVWARYYRGELSADSNYDSSFSQDYTGFQGGIDKVQDYKGGKLYTGIAVNRIDSNAGYTVGSGDLSSTGVGLYGSWLGSKGHYLDVIARGSKLTNDFKLVDLSGNAAKADYDTWAYGISAEYGYRQDLNAGWFVEPQAELSLGHISRVDYTTSNGVSIRQDGVNSAIVRLGFLGGKEFSIGGRPSNAYVKASLLHDFGGNGGPTGYYGIKSLAMQTGDLTGSWYEIGLGANLGITKNSNLYFDALKTLNSTVRTDWQFNAGLRFTF